MTEQVMRNIHRIPVPLPGNPLKELNSYLIRGDRDLLIDTGFRRPECYAALQAGLEELKVDRSRLDILVTHLHSDHSGLASDFIGEGRHIYISNTDRALLEEKRDELLRRQNERILLEGMSPQELDMLAVSNPARVLAPPRGVACYRGLEDGDRLEVGDYCLRAVLVPGHTPGNMVFWMEEQKAMFTGDHVLFDITPNITAWPWLEDSLGSYLESLNRVREYPVERALPAHRATGDLHARVERLKVHHSERIDEARQVVRRMPGLAGYGIAGHMTWKIRADNWESFPLVQKWFAVGECLSHLDYLKKRGEIRCEEEGGLRRYYAN